MRSRGLVVVLALVLATLATVGVFLYSRGVKEDARAGGDLVTVVVSKVDIPANTDLNQLIREGEFVTADVNRDTLVRGAITEVSQLQNRRNNVFILAGEQIPLSRVQGGQVPGGIIGIPEGHQAMTVSLDAPRAIAGALAGGDSVTIYATFEDVELTLLEGGQRASFSKVLQRVIRQQQQAAQQATAGQQRQQIEIPRFDTTVILAPEVEVLRVIRPQTQGGVAGQTTQSNEGTGNISVTMAFLPEEAQHFVLALELGKVYLSLLPPDQAGVQLDPITVAQVILPAK